jgi:hypothetical protein
MSALKWNSNPRYFTANGYSTEMELLKLSRGVRGVVYHACNYYGYGNRSWLIVTGPKGGKRSLRLGYYKTMDEAKRACEQHWADGCDLTGTEPELTMACERAEARAAMAATA